MFQLVWVLIDLVFVHLRPHYRDGRYCTQSRLVPVPGSQLLIKPLWESRVLPKNTNTRRPWPGLEPGLLNLESSTLTTLPSMLNININTQQLIGGFRVYCNDQRANSKKKKNTVANFALARFVTCSWVSTYHCLAWVACRPIVFNHDKQVYHTRNTQQFIGGFRVFIAMPNVRIPPNPPKSFQYYEGVLSCLQQLK